MGKNSRATVWTPAMDKMIIEASKNNKSASSLLPKLGVSKSALFRRAKKLNLTFKRSPVSKRKKISWTNNNLTSVPEHPLSHDPKLKEAVEYIQRRGEVVIYDQKRHRNKFLFSCRWVSRQTILAIYQAYLNGTTRRVAA